MGKINILPAKVFNRIAAGEVVDRPYSVVKELVENAIDAGATEIEVYIEKGGKQLIRIIDNGCGIEREDLQSAFMPHATSKITTAEDLNTITTLGFRGEAIASIASVSKMTITSKVKGEKCYSLTSDGGELGNIVQSAGNDGTEVSVEMLFFNAPVRLGFLKTDKGEEADITNFISRFILCRSDIAFTYYADGKKLLQSFGTGDEEAFLSIYGASVLSQCIRIDAEKHGIRVRGYIGNQNYSKPNKSHINIFLNGRFVFNTTITASLTGAYNAYLMKRQFPFCVLHITMPPQIVDVNVHPNKSDVRFANNNIIYGTIYSIISAVLDGHVSAVEYILPSPASAPTPTPLQETEKEPITQETIALPVAEEKPKPRQSGISESILALDEEVTEHKKPLKEKVFDEPKKPSKSFGFATFTYEDAQREIEQNTLIFTEVKEEKVTQITDKGYYSLKDIPDLPQGLLVKARHGKRKVSKKKSGSGRLKSMFPDLPMQKRGLKFHDSDYEQVVTASSDGDAFMQNKRYLEELDLKATQDKIDINACVYQGKLFNTYLLYECNNDIYIIDQHAAHERLIYNRLREKMRSRTVNRQPMLLPYELSVNAVEGAFIREKLTEITEIGFDIQENGLNSFAVTAIPADLPRIDIQAFFGQILSDIDGYKAIKIDELLKDKLATTACKSAVKGGMDLSKDEAVELLRQMDGDMSLKCPHGRPVVIKLTRTDLEKLFKRIV